MRPRTCSIPSTPSAEHWFGTDAGGRICGTRVWVGARISLIIGLGGAIVPQIIGIFWGLSGFSAAGWICSSCASLMWVCIPSLVYVTLIMLCWTRAPWPLSSPLPLLLAGWTRPRIVRGRMLQLKTGSLSCLPAPWGLSHPHYFPPHPAQHPGPAGGNISSAIPAAIFLRHT